MSAPKKKLLLLSHERSLNKSQSLINFFEHEFDIVLVVNQEVSPHKTYTQLCSEILISSSFQIDEITAKIKKCDKILCVSENLLPVQSQLETHYGINNLSFETAKVLSDKFLLADYLNRNNAPVKHPTTTIARNRADLSSLEGSFIIKPSIGTGSNYFLENQLEGLDYSFWNSREDLSEELQKRHALELFFTLNREGIQKKRFNNKKNFMLFQKYIPADGPVYSPIGYFGKQGLVIPFYLKLIRFNSQIEGADFHSPELQLNELCHSEETPSVLGDLLVMSVAKDEVPKEFQRQAESYLSFLFESLKIKELFFAGPDLHKRGDEFFAIDFNPRMGHFFNLIDHVNNNNLIESMVNGLPLNILNHCLWGAIPTKLSEIVNEGNLSAILEYIPQEALPQNYPHPLPQKAYLQSKPRSLQVLLQGRNEAELTRNYFEIIQKFI